MKPFLVGTVAVVLFGAGAAGLVAWLTREPDAAGTAEAPPTVAEEAPVRELRALPEEAPAREVALEANEETREFNAFARGFASTRRSPRSEARVLPALELLFPKDGPRWRLECRRLLCRLDVDEPAFRWRQPFAESHLLRQEVDRSAFDPDGTGLAFFELVEARAAAGPPRPEGARVLDELARALLASDAARECVAGGAAPRGAEVRLMIDRSGITYRFGAGVDPGVASCLMTRAMPDVMATAAAPADVRRAERKVLVPASAELRTAARTPDGEPRP